MCPYQYEDVNLPMIHDGNVKKDIQGTPIPVSATITSNLPDPIQPTIFYMAAVLPVQLQSVTKMLDFSTSAPVDARLKNTLPPPFSRSSIWSCSSSSSSSLSPASSSLSSYSNLDDELDDEPNSTNKCRNITRIPLLLNPIKEDDNSKCTTMTGKLQYNCKFCSKKFMRPSSLKIHIYSHTGEKPFHCTHTGCRRKFSVQSNMRRHLRVHSS